VIIQSGRIAGGGTGPASAGPRGRGSSQQGTPIAQMELIDKLRAAGYENSFYQTSKSMNLLAARDLADQHGHGKISFSLLKVRSAAEKREIATQRAALRPALHRRHLDQAHLNEARDLLLQHARSVGQSGRVAREGGLARDRASGILEALGFPHEWREKMGGMDQAVKAWSYGEVAGYKPHNRADPAAVVDRALAASVEKINRSRAEHGMSPLSHKP